MTYLLEKVEAFLSRLPETTVDQLFERLMPRAPVLAAMPPCDECWVVDENCSSVCVSHHQCHWATGARWCEVTIRCCDHCADPPYCQDQPPVFGMRCC